MYFIGMVHLNKASEAICVGEEEKDAYLLEKVTKEHVNRVVCEFGSNIGKKKCFQALLIAQLFGGGRGTEAVNAVMENEQHVWWWTGFYTWLCISGFVAITCGICIFFWIGKRMWLHLEERLERIVHEVLENERAIGEIRRDVLALQIRSEDMPEEEGNEEDWRELHYWSRPVIDGIHEEDGPVSFNEGGTEPEPHPEAPEVEWPENESFSQFVMRQVFSSPPRLDTRGRTHQGPSPLALARRHTERACPLAARLRCIPELCQLPCPSQPCPGSPQSAPRRRFAALPSPGPENEAAPKTGTFGQGKASSFCTMTFTPTVPFTRK